MSLEITDFLPIASKDCLELWQSHVRDDGCDLSLKCINSMLID